MEVINVYSAGSLTLQTLQNISCKRALQIMRLRYNELSPEVLEENGVLTADQWHAWVQEGRVSFERETVDIEAAFMSLQLFVQKCEPVDIEAAIMRLQLFVQKCEKESICENVDDECEQSIDRVNVCENLEADRECDILSLSDENTCSTACISECMGLNQSSETPSLAHSADVHALHKQLQVSEHDGVHDCTGQLYVSEHESVHECAGMVYESRNRNERKRKRKKKWKYLRVNKRRRESRLKNESVFRKTASRCVEPGWMYVRRRKLVKKRARRMSVKKIREMRMREKGMKRSLRRVLVKDLFESMVEIERQCASRVRPWSHLLRWTRTQRRGHLWGVSGANPCWKACQGWSSGPG